MLGNEVAIPFAAFTGEPEAILDVTADEIDGTIVVAGPAGHATTYPGSALPPARALAGRAVIALAGAGTGSPHSIEAMVDGLLDRLAHRSGVGEEIYAHQAHEHRAPNDLDYWAGVDTARGRLATALDVVVCSHYLGSPERTYVVTIEGPLHRLGLLVAAAEDVQEAARRVLLTPDGPVTNEPEHSVLVLAAARHAQRLGGRAEVFPGQEWLAGEPPVADVLGRTAVDEVRSTQGTFDSAAMLRAYGYVRPSYDRGALVLAVGQDDPQVVTPWEARYSRPCCEAG